MVEMVKPPITVIAMGFHISEPSEADNAKGVIPKMVVMVVINTGRKRDLPPLTTAWMMPMPRLRFRLDSQPQFRFSLQFLPT